ncbi:ribosome maturation factor RimP [Candidatus Methylomirabilis limnetica]|jgi:ribosome maturation factor RimP|uniref:Ribosome maturation factor RimP n=1 Tax=Candidatus Methylomirabilis limnetica TaxID=2033718 RepID=A0A2T4TX36_9BACT|nr:ribosome maturation factor RimP [Candidatus Methylomirabilis limnetica]PTL35682.1 ribosome maturation factor RimP [Candidatus Methylomirabilis limnetica]
MTGEVVERVRTIAIPLFMELGLELVDVEFRREANGWILRLYIDKPGGVVLGDCQRVSEELSDLLDIEDLIGHPYSLEVSSPGLYRPLRLESDFLRFVGQRARISTSSAVAGQRRFLGILRGYEEERILLEREDGTIALIPYALIVKSRLDPIL